MQPKTNIFKVFSQIICTNINKCFITTILIFSLTLSSCITPSNIRNKKVYGYKDNATKSYKQSRNKQNDNVKSNGDEESFEDLIIQAKKEERAKKRKKIETPATILKTQISNTDNKLKLTSLDKQMNELRLNQNLVANKVNSIENDITDIKYSLTEIKNAINQLKAPQATAVTGITQKSDKKETSGTETQKSHQMIIKSEEDLNEDELDTDSDQSYLDKVDKIEEENYSDEFLYDEDNYSYNENLYQNVDKDKNNQDNIKLAPKEQKTLNEAIENAKDKNFHKAIVKLLILENKKLDKISKSNVEYWLGESHYGLKQYKKAVKYFLAVLQSGNNKIYDDSKLKIANAYIKSGKPENAKTYYKKLITEHPKSKFVPKARKMLQQL